MRLRVRSLAHPHPTPALMWGCEYLGVTGNLPRNIKGDPLRPRGTQMWLKQTCHKNTTTIFFFSQSYSHLFSAAIFPISKQQVNSFIDAGFIKRLCALNPCLVSGFFSHLFSWGRRTFWFHFDRKKQKWPGLVSGLVLSARPACHSHEW